MSKNGHTVAVPAGISAGFNLFQEVVVRLALFAVYMYFETKEPFIRKIHPDEMWLYRNPRTASYVPLTALYPASFGLAAAVFLAYYIRSRDWTDFKCAWLGLTLAITINGVITHTIKVAVGRPRPDFFWRCFPDGEMNADMVCSGEASAVIDGRKSFPSGHSSYAFAALGFISWYLFGKLHVFTERGRGQSWRLLAALVPLMAAVFVAISRTCDYHHHWQDVTIGSLIGLVEGYICYRQYYPPMDSRVCYLPYTSDSVSSSPCRKVSPRVEIPRLDTEPDAKMLLEAEDKDTKWT